MPIAPKLLPVPMDFPLLIILSLFILVKLFRSGKVVPIAENGLDEYEVGVESIDPLC